MVTFILVVIGGLNWGLIGLGDLFGSSSSWDLVYMIFGSWPMIESLIYILIGISAVLLVISHKKDCTYCAVSGTSPSAASNPMM